MYTAQIEAIAQRIRENDRQKRFVLHPNKNKYLPLWDVISTIALLYTAALTPFEAAFIAPVLGPSAWKDAWFVINRILDAIFVSL